MNYYEFKDIIDHFGFDFERAMSIRHMIGSAVTYSKRIDPTKEEHINMMFRDRRDKWIDKCIYFIFKGE